MADLKRRTLSLSTGKQIKLFGNSLAIGKTLEIGESYAPNILSFNSEQSPGTAPAKLHNPHNLTSEEIIEIADYMTRLWMDLKDNIRRYGMDNPKIFSRD